MLQLPGKHIAFIFSDPAGANACIAFALMIQAKGIQKTSLFCNKRYDQLPVQNLEVVDEVPDLRALEVDCVFTGTSHPQTSAFFEVHAIEKAKAQGIQTLSFVDHWVNFRLRFEDERKQLVLPDEIWVLDEKAKKLAMEEGLPESILQISQNPYHAYLQEYWKPAYKEKSYLEQLRLPSPGFHILFVPDPLSIRNGQEKFGFTETDALQDVLDALPHSRLPVYLIVKAHPLQPLESLEKAAANNNVFIVKDADPLELIHAVDVVVGIFSNLILEAYLLKKPSVRYFPAYGRNDLFHSELPVSKFESRQDLQFFLQQQADKTVS